MACIFCSIAAGSAPATFVHRDEHVVAFEDLHPLAPAHVLVVPRAHVASLWDLEDRALAGHLLAACALVARAKGLAQGFRVIANSGRYGGQEVEHLHLHVVGGRPLGPMLARAR